MMATAVKPAQVKLEPEYNSVEEEPYVQVQEQHNPFLPSRHQLPNLKDEDEEDDEEDEEEEDEEEEEEEEDDEEDEQGIKQEKDEPDFGSDSDSDNESYQESGSDWDDDGDEEDKNIKKDRGNENHDDLVDRLKKEINDETFEYDLDKDAMDLDADIVYYVCLEDAKEKRKKFREKVKDEDRVRRAFTRLPTEVEKLINVNKVNGKYKCFKCSKSYVIKNSLKDHMKDKHMFGDFQCKVCDSFPVYFLGELFEHHTQRHEQFQFECPSCDAKFLVEEGLVAYEAHYKANHVFKKNKYKKPDHRVCDICGQTLSSKLSLYRHMNSHLGIKPIKCDECDFATTYANSLNDHKKIHLKEKGLYVEPRVFCEICGNSFSSPFLMKEHILNIHEGQKNRHECKECGERFTYVSTMRRHIARVHRLRPFESDINRTKYRRNRPSEFLNPPAPPKPKASTSGLDEEPKKKKKRKSGISKQTGEFPCSYCQKVLRTEGNLKDHTRLHTGEKPYECEICGSKHTSSSDLSRHRRGDHGTTKTGDPPTPKKQFVCTVCSKVFVKPNVFSDHMDSHNGIKGYPCPECSWSTSFKNAWRMHMKSKHGWNTTANKVPKHPKREIVLNDENSQ